MKVQSSIALLEVIMQKPPVWRHPISDKYKGKIEGEIDLSPSSGGHLSKRRR